MDDSVTNLLIEDSPNDVEVICVARDGQSALDHLYFWPVQRRTSG